MRILIFSRSAWDNTNSTGNTLSNLFASFKKDDLANLYFRQALPSNTVCNQYFSLSDKDILLSLIKPWRKTGHFFEYDNIKEPVATNTSISQEAQMYNRFRGNANPLVILLQGLLWRVGFWRSVSLKRFLADFKPDIIFSPAFANGYTHRVLWYAQKQTHAPIVLFHADDYINIDSSIKRPLEKLNQDLRISAVKKSIAKAQLNYCISKKQADEYMQLLGKPMKLLSKSADFTTAPKFKHSNTNMPLKMVYIGSTQNERWKTLGTIAKQIKKLNDQKPSFELSIYSQYPLTDEETKMLVMPGVAKFLGKLNQSQIPDVIKKADILLHVEPLSPSAMMKNRLSFSTKIVDYLQSGRCIMAVGPKACASISFFITTNAGLVALSGDQILSKLKDLQHNPTLLLSYAKNAWQVGKTHFNKADIDRQFKADLNKLIKK